MKLISLNAWTGRTKDLLVEYLNQERADIVCLQEIMSIVGNPGLFRSIEQISDRCNYAERFVSPAFSFNYMHRTATLGNAIISGQPIDKPTTRYTHLTYLRDFDYDKDSYDIRCLQHAIIEADGLPCHVLNYQGHHVRTNKNGDEHSLAHSQLIADYVQTLFGPVILVGDFNLIPDSPALKPLQAHLRNLSVEYKLTTTRTRLTAKTDVCDYVFVNKHVQVDSFASRDVLISDHRPLVLEFSL